MNFRLDKKLGAETVSKGILENRLISASESIVQNELKEESFKSRFKSWIRLVALVVVLIFLPEQVSWAFNYNPAVLWGHSSSSVQVIDLDSPNPQVSQEEMMAIQLSSGVANLLEQIENKENAQIKLGLSSDINNSLSSEKSVLISAKRKITPDYVQSVKSWIRNPNIHPFNCGVYALKDLLDGNKISTSLAEIAVATLSVDLLNNIIEPGEKFLKTSLFAIEEVARGYGLNVQAVKVDTQDILYLKTPFIANFGSEHFVTVRSVDAQNVYFSDIGKQQSMPRDQFKEKISGFVLAVNLDRQEDMEYEPISDAMKVFVWGNKWIDRSDDLPGLLSGADVFAAVISMVVQIVIAYIMGGPLGVIISLASSTFGSAVGEAYYVNCVNDGGDDCESNAFILSTAITIAVSVGLNYMAGIGSEAGNAAGEAAASGGETALESTASTGATSSLSTALQNAAVGAAVGAALGWAVAKMTGKDATKAALIGGLIGAAGGLIAGYGGFGEGIQSAWQSLITKLQNIWSSIKGFFNKVFGGGAASTATSTTSTTSMTVTQRLWDIAKAFAKGFTVGMKGLCSS